MVNPLVQKLVHGQLSDVRVAAGAQQMFAAQRTHELDTIAAQRFEFVEQLVGFAIAIAA